MVLYAHLHGGARCVRGARFATTAEPSDRTQWMHSDFVQGLFVDGVKLVVSGAVSRQLLFKLPNVQELLLLWMRPRAQRARNSPQAMFMWHATGCVLTLMLTSWQLRRGAERVGLPRRRCMGLPRALVRALQEPQLAHEWESMLERLVNQSEVLLDLRRDPACVYMVAGERAAYIGSTSQRSRPGTRGALGVPAVRIGQHLSDVVRSSFKSGLHKVRSMAKEMRGMLVAFVVLAGDTQSMRCAEEYLIWQTRPCGNTSLATRGGWRRAPKATQATPRMGRRRPWPQQRCDKGSEQGPLECLRRDMPKVVAIGIAREEAHETARAARDVHECQFPEAYVAYQAGMPRRRTDPRTSERKTPLIS